MASPFLRLRLKLVRLVDALLDAMEADDLEHGQRRGEEFGGAMAVGYLLSR